MSVDGGGVWGGGSLLWELSGCGVSWGCGGFDCWGGGELLVVFAVARWSGVLAIVFDFLTAAVQRVNFGGSGWVRPEGRGRRGWSPN